MTNLFPYEGGPLCTVGDEVEYALGKTRRGTVVAKERWRIDSIDGVTATCTRLTGLFKGDTTTARIERLRKAPPAPDACYCGHVDEDRDPCVMCGIAICLGDEAGHGHYEGTDIAAPLCSVACTDAFYAAVATA